ncbi:MAG: NTF2-like N-terminal transpeptidase domain-containing protein [Actinomycetota bacterium]|nr:NTF2-like N-terminal transpeptidase domain-containing protein [Actinomycetota bacterium]
MYLESAKKLLYGCTAAAAIILLGISLLSCAVAEDLERNIINRFTSEESLDRAVETTQDFFDALMAKDYQQAYQMISSQDKQDHSYDQFVQEFDDVTDIIFLK